MPVADAPFESDRRALLGALVNALEAALPPGVPARTSGQRTVKDVLVPTATEHADALLASLTAAPGGELSPTASGQVAMASAESSALLAVNFLAPWATREGSLLGVRCDELTVEQQLRVTGVRAPVGPTLDAVIEGPDGTVCVEAKCAEPWRGAPKLSISEQYDEPAQAASPGLRQTVQQLRADALAYRCLDAAQLLKHLLGIHSAIDAGVLAEPVALTLLFWRPSDAGRFESLFDRLEAELDDFAGRVADQPVAVVRASTRELLRAWSTQDSEAWQREHAAALTSRYDITLPSH